MRILFLQPPVSYEVLPYFQSEGLGIAYLTSVLRADGHEVEIIDGQLRGLNPMQTVHEALTREFDCLGITASHEQKRELAFTARAIRNQRQDAIICAGGYLPTLSTEVLLTACPELDFVVRGEAEIAARDIFGRIARGEDWRDAPGVAYRNENELVTNPVGPVVHDLDSLPFPARDALMDSVFPLAVRLAGSRGCYHRCSFCSIQSMHEISGIHAPRLRSPRSIADEIETVLAATGIKRFRFIDDDSLGPSDTTHRRVAAIAEEIRSRNMGITLAMECRADSVREDTLKLLKEAGLNEVFMGIESGVQRQLDTYDKHLTVAQNRRAIEIVRNCGLKLRSGFMMFDPYLTVPELAENIQFINETGIAEETIGITPVPFITKVHLYHNVPLYDRLKRDGLLVEKGMDVDYAFRDRWIRFIYRSLLILGSISHTLKSLRWSRKRAA